MKEHSWEKYHFIKSFCHEFYKNHKGAVITLNPNFKASALPDLVIYPPLLLFLSLLTLLLHLIYQVQIPWCSGSSVGCLHGFCSTF